jgi:LuxR family maltose regulon positive regulatory protein
VAADTARVRSGWEASLLATKLHVPDLPAAFVSRARLLDLLDASAPRRLVVVCAPAGFGKSALLADWVRQKRRPSAWLSLEEADNDPVRFWRHVVAALDQVLPGIDERLSPLLGPPAPESFVGFVATLINTLAESERSVTPAALALDDLHVIDAPPVVESFTYFAEHRPAALQLLIGSRIDPPLPLARMRVRGELTEIRAEQLRFTPEEAAALLRGAVEGDIPADAVAALTARTEGWAAGLQLAGLSLRGEADPARFIADFSGSHRFVLDYLTEEVLERQPAEVTEFLLQTSVLDRLSGPLCDALTGRSDGQQMLERLERANLFLIPLDQVRGWWRYHQLFADLLRARLRHRHPDRVARLHDAASAWYDEHGFIDAAAQHAMAGGNIDRLAELRGDADDAVEHASRALAAARPGEWMLRIHATGYLALAYWLQGRLPAAERMLVESIAQVSPGRPRPTDARGAGADRA